MIEPVPSPLPRAADKASTVQSMFDRIAPRYDRVNRLMTFGADMRWRRAVVRRLAIGPHERVLDLACGTGDFLEIVRPLAREAVGIDFSGVMLAEARERHGSAASLVQGDALRLPFAGAIFDAAVSGFALRNFAALEPAFRELARVIKPGGRVGLLEVDRPRNPAVRAGHALYFECGVPLIGGVLSGDREAYRYLPASAVYLPPGRELAGMLQAAGFVRVRKQRFMLGAAQAIYAERAQ
jgi:demethylmenaquinone methyltransferase/2-methoxy-6-polyprenyl-1,4-benzoquinol methylase